MIAKISQDQKNIKFHSSLLSGLDLLEADGEKGVFDVIESLKNFSEAFVQENDIQKITTSDYTEYYMIKAPNDYRVLFTFDHKDILVVDIFPQQRLDFLAKRLKKNRG